MGDSVTVLKFSGVLNIKSSGDPGGEVFIGERDVFAEVSEVFADGTRVYVALADEYFDGDLYAEDGIQGYSEWTPGEACQLKIGKHDLVQRLDDIFWKAAPRDVAVTLWVADEPVNTLEDNKDRDE